MNADNALFLGTAIHTGIEKGVEEAIKEYYMSYPIIDDLHINESIKLECLIPKVRELLPKGEHEIKIENADFKGFLDLLVKSDDSQTASLYDFKYSNNIENYMESGQLHEYKYFYELENPGVTITKMYFVFVPKVKIKQKKTEDLQQFRNRIVQELEKTSIKIVPVQFDYKKVIDFAFSIKNCLEATEFKENYSYLCGYCEYQEYCEKGWDYMLLPSVERRNVDQIVKKVLWLYGSPFSGKTYLANKFPNPLMLNTDGNIKFVDAPYIAIKNIVTVEGRLTKTTLAWDVFKDAITELEKKQNEFKTIVVDLIEDCYEHCRVYMYGQMGITHESDDSFRAWDKVRGEFLNTLKRLMNMDYENIILISHEDTSKDITKKGGDKVTAIKPNLNDKAANKVAGMVDIVARVIADDNVRTLNFKTNEVIFGGGRLNVTANTIPLDYDALMLVYAEANSGKSSAPTTSTTPGGRNSRTKKEEPTADENVTPSSEEKQLDVVEEDKPKTRTSKSKQDIPNVEDATPSVDTSEGAVEATVVTRTRKKRE